MGLNNCGVQHSGKPSHKPDVSPAPLEFGVLRSLAHNQGILQLVKDVDGQIEALVRDELPYNQKVVVSRRPKSSKP